MLLMFKKKRFQKLNMLFLHLIKVYCRGSQTVRRDALVRRVIISGASQNIYLFPKKIQFLSALPACGPTT